MTNSREYTEAELKFMAVMAENGPSRCAWLGERMWGADSHGAVNCSCPFARPAGKMIKRLRQLGLVADPVRDKYGSKYHLTIKGQKVLSDQLQMSQ